MDQTESELSSFSASDPEWSVAPLYKDNLIYLPFARHLAEIDEAEEQELKAA